MKKSREVRVLVVEDDHLVSETIKVALEEIGYTTIGEATNGHQAIALTQSLQPDVVLMDIRMPDMDGIEATREIQKQCPTPVVVLTAHETPDLIEEASAAGVGAYLIKPPIAGDLERAIMIAIARFQDLLELRRLNQDLQAYNEELDAFAHIVAHDLQNPVSLVIGYAEAVIKYCKELPEETLMECLQTIYRTGQRMSATIDQLLMLTQAHKATVEMKPLDMASIVTAAQKRLADLIQGYDAQITKPATWPMALGYAPWIEEVWVSYLSNAIRYGSQPARLELGAATQPNGYVRFWVRDNGPALEPEDTPPLFAPLQQNTSTPTRGYGYGMAIVQRLVAKLGGKAEIESDNIPGHGSTFAFTLPAVRNRKEAT